MAVGDVVQKKLLNKSLDATLENNMITNRGSNIKTTITSITLKLQTGATQIRTICGYIYGTDASCEFFSIDLNPNEVHTHIMNQLDFVLSNVETMSFKVNEGTDVNIFVMGIEETIA